MEIFETEQRHALCLVGLSEFSRNGADVGLVQKPPLHTRSLDLSRLLPQARSQQKQCFLGFIIIGLSICIFYSFLVLSLTAQQQHCSLPARRPFLSLA